MSVKVAVALLGLLSVFGANSRAWASENYQLFRVDVGPALGYGTSLGNWAFGTFVEPKFNVTDLLAVGMRIEGLISVGGEVGREEVSLKVGGSGAFMAKADFFFTKIWIRPFVGFGMGYFVFGGQDVDSSSTSSSVKQEAGRAFGIAPQVGVNLGLVRLAVSYNLLFGGGIRAAQSVASGEASTSIEQRIDGSTGRHYLLFCVGFRIGGKRRSPAALR